MKKLFNELVTEKNVTKSFGTFFVYLVRKTISSNIWGIHIDVVDGRRKVDFSKGFTAFGDNA